MHTKLIAFDLDGTLTQHKTAMEKANREALEKLDKRYQLVMVGAGLCQRIFEQMEHFPIDIVGSYGMQYARYNADKDTLDMVFDRVIPCDRALCEARIKKLRSTFGFQKFWGNAVEYHASGCVTFPLLGTKARPEEKLAFDPDRRRRRAMYEAVVQAFPEYNVFVGGSSSFDMAPKPFDKQYALKEYCEKNGFLPSETVFVGDDYGKGGNDEAVYRSDFSFVKVDDYRNFPSCVSHLL